MFDGVFPPLCASAVMQLGDTELSLGSSPLLRHGVELSKDQTGVTAQLMGFNISMFFDGDIAQIHLRGTEHVLSHKCCFSKRNIILLYADCMEQ